MTTQIDLLHAIADAEADHLPIPCRVAANPDRWFHVRKVERDEVARLCKECPIKVVCGQYGADANECAGVWGGIDRGGAMGEGRVG